MLRDFYHALLRMPWPGTLLAIALAYLGVNVLFACAYLGSGGVAHAAPGSFADAFFFSVQTMGTVGYGAMYPESRLERQEPGKQALSLLFGGSIINSSSVDGPYVVRNVRLKQVDTHPAHEADPIAQLPPTPSWEAGGFH